MSISPADWKQHVNVQLLKQGDAGFLQARRPLPICRYDHCACIRLEQLFGDNHRSSANLLLMRTAGWQEAAMSTPSSLSAKPIGAVYACTSDADASESEASSIYCWIQRFWSGCGAETASTASAASATPPLAPPPFAATPAAGAAAVLETLCGCGAAASAQALSAPLPSLWAASSITGCFTRHQRGRRRQ